MKSTPADPSDALTVATPCASPRSYAAAFLVAALGVGLLGWMISTKDGGTVARGAAAVPDYPAQRAAVLALVDGLR